MAISLKFWVAVAAILATAQCTTTPSAETIAAATTDLQNLIYNERDGDESSFIVAYLRLKLNDCAGDACDGCLDSSDPDNEDLQSVTDHLDGLYDASYSDTFSRADFYELAIQVAIDMTSDDNVENFPGFQDMVYGREDCTTSPAEDDKTEVLPKRNANPKEATKYYKDHFNLNSREAIAIMGMHTLDAAKKGKSDPKKATDGASKTTKFYSKMMDHPKSLLPSEHRPIVSEFANDNGKWKKELHSAFKKVGNKHGALEKKENKVKKIMKEIDEVKDEVQKLKAQMN